MNYFKDDASKEVLKGAYMDDLIGNFDAKFLTDPTQFVVFGDKLKIMQKFLKFLEKKCLKKCCSLEKFLNLMQKQQKVAS